MADVSIFLDANLVDSTVAINSTFTIPEHGDGIIDLDPGHRSLGIELVFISHAVFASGILYPDPRGAGVENHFEFLLLLANPNIGVKLNIIEGVQILLNKLLLPCSFPRSW